MADPTPEQLRERAKQAFLNDPIFHARCVMVEGMLTDADSDDMVIALSVLVGSMAFPGYVSDSPLLDRIVAEEAVRTVTAEDVAAVTAMEQSPTRSFSPRRMSRKEFLEQASREARSDRPD